MSAGVIVNEGLVEMSGRGVDWWTDFRRASHPSRFTEITPACVIGGTVRVECDSGQDAANLAEHMVENAGMPKRAVRVEVNS